MNAILFRSAEGRSEAISETTFQSSLRLRLRSSLRQCGSKFDPLDWHGWSRAL